MLAQTRKSAQTNSAPRLVSPREGDAMMILRQGDLTMPSQVDPIQPLDPPASPTGAPSNASPSPVGCMARTASAQVPMGASTWPRSAVAISVRSMSRPARSRNQPMAVTSWGPMISRLTPKAILCNRYHRGARQRPARTGQPGCFRATCRWRIRSRFMRAGSFPANAASAAHHGARLDGGAPRRSWTRRPCPMPSRSGRTRLDSP